MGKGDTPRPMSISREEYHLRWAYFIGDITTEEFDKRLREIRENNGT